MKEVLHSAGKAEQFQAMKVENNTQLKRMISYKIEANIRTIWKKHIKRFSKKLYTQLHGAIFDISVAVDVAGFYMTRWDRKLGQSIAENPQLS